MFILLLSLIFFNQSVRVKFNQTKVPIFSACNYIKKIVIIISFRNFAISTKRV